ncbi:hypothetical protein ACIQI8_41000 [Streptomyces sp. NPDC092369]|uniref:hypothetical protein n=1 Tax=Streptomyces sp. NPDC092369 TaxID=3366015 RepID=UPI003825E75B
MAVLAVLIPPFMLGLVLALDRFEELLLPPTDTGRPTPVVTPSTKTPTENVIPVAIVRPSAEEARRGLSPSA